MRAGGRAMTGIAIDMHDVAGSDRLLVFWFWACAACGGAAADGNRGRTSGREKFKGVGGV